MKDEIKEILDNLKYCKEHDKENNYYPEDIFSKDEPYILLDYITNLQNENEDLKNQVEHLNESNYENEVYKIRCKRALKLVNNLISDDDCFYIYDILESKKQELKHVLEGEYDE